MWLLQNHKESGCGFYGYLSGCLEDVGPLDSSDQLPVGVGVGWCLKIPR